MMKGFIIFYITLTLAVLASSSAYEGYGDQWSSGGGRQFGEGYQAGSYGGGYGGGIGGGQSYGGIGGGIGGISGGRGRQATIQQTVQETVHETEHEAASHAATHSAEGYGAGGGVVAAGQSYQGQRSRSRTVTKTTTTTINYQEQWPQLYEEPLFQDICNLESNARSKQISERFLQKSKYNYESIFSNLYKKNRLFQRYIFAATGIQDNEYDSRKFFGLVNQNPGSLLRMVSLFAKHPRIYKNTVAEILFQRSSYEILNYRSFTPNFFDDDYLIALTSSQTYRKLFSSVFSCGLDAKTIRSRLRRAFLTNKNGTLLMVRHVLTRRALFSFDEYMGVNHVIYNSKKHYWGKKKFRHNTYFSKYFLKRGAKRRGSLKLKAQKGKKLRTLQYQMHNNSDSS